MEMHMARTKKKDLPTTEEALPPGATDFNPSEFEKGPAPVGTVVDQVLANAHQAAVANEHDAQHTNGNVKNHAAGIQKREFKREEDPRGWENIRAGQNRVRLLKSEGEGAWVIRFAHNPNDDKGPNGETYSKENPHPVLAMLKKEEGYRWGFDGGDGKGGWGKPFSGDPYGTDHIEARRVLQKAADMIGQPKEQGRIPD
jgi:hypothetical protein